MCDFYLKKVLNEKDRFFPLHTTHHEYAITDSFLDPSLPEIQKIHNLYTKNILMIPPITRNQILNTIPSHLYWLIPEISHFYRFPIRVMVVLSPLSPSQLDMFIRVFSLLPYIELYECVKYDNPNKAVLFADLRFFNSHIHQFYMLLRDIVVKENIKEFYYLPRVTELTYHDFANINEYYIPLIQNAHKWNPRSRRYHTIKYFDSSGRPIDIINQDVIRRKKPRK